MTDSKVVSTVRDISFEINYSYGGRKYGSVRSGIRKSMRELLKLCGCKLLDETEYGNQESKLVVYDVSTLHDPNSPVVDGIKAIMESYYGVASVKIFVPVTDDDETTHSKEEKGSA